MLRCINDGLFSFRTKHILGKIKVRIIQSLELNLIARRKILILVDNLERSVAFLVWRSINAVELVTIA